MSPLAVYVDTEQTLSQFQMASGHGAILKHQADLDRYSAIIEATAPQVIVECGTNAGASAAWFARQGLQVVTIDTNPRLSDRQTIARVWPTAAAHITYVTGSSVDPAVYEQATDLVAGRRCMVSLDSDHSAEHVAAEIRLYGQLVSAGCYLVVEDTIFRFATPVQWRRHHFGDPARGNPLDAVEAELVGNPGWRRDVEIEARDPVSHHPAGWWVRTDMP